MTQTEGPPDWDSERVEDLGGGVYRIPLPLPNDGLRAVNVYAVLESSRLSLIDAGWAVADSEQRLEVALKTLSLSMGDITDFFVTHIHRDHYSQAIELRRKLGTRVSLGIGEKANLDEMRRPGRHTTSTAEPGRLRRHGAQELLKDYGAEAQPPADFLRNAENPDCWLNDGDVLQLQNRRLDVIATPGHTRGHVVFRDSAAGLLFAGDHVLPRITPSMGLEPLPLRWPLRDFIDSLLLIRALPDTMLYPAHGPITTSVHSRIDELLRHHEVRLDEAMAAVIEGAKTAYQSASLLRWTRRGRTLDELTIFDRLLATAETSAHLDVLVLQGRARSETVEGTEFYYPA
jgi:glyoxylase-like metal-dependent hydrolase (beta-lactamase superfamily II)